MRAAAGEAEAAVADAELASGGSAARQDLDEASNDGPGWDWASSGACKVLFALLLGSVPVVPLLPRGQWSASAYFAALAVWAVYVGAHRSLKHKQAQSISLRQSVLVPMACSASLLGFYCLLRFFPSLDVRAFVSAYLSLAGAVAVGSNLSDPLALWLPALNASASRRFDLPEWLATDKGGPVHVTVRPTDVVAAVAGIAAALAARQGGAPFTLNNFVAVCIVTELLQLLSLGSFTTAAAMLGGLLVYDVFWVFGSSSFFGDNVMVTVATSPAFDGPMKLTFPSWVQGAAHDSILGLGDVAAPGLLLALMLRFDRQRSRQLAGAASTPDDVPAADKSYFTAGLASYLAGLAVTIGVNSFSGAAQPALLYLVPALLGGVLLNSLARGEAGLLLGYRDEPLVTPAPVLVEVNDESPPP